VRAWDQATGSRDIVVGVIDTGIDYNHPDLAANIYKNPGESGNGKENNGIDDDANGFIDDHVGWNFAGVSTNNPMDDNSHGTHCAGTIGAVANNGIGVAGVAWNVRMMPIKFLTGGGSGTLADAVKSIQYATLMNVNVMSNSWGGGGFSQAMLDAINAAKAKGILFVAAAGNDGSNTDSSPQFPSSYQVDNVFAVAASDNRDQLASFSNFGKRSVLIAAPGVKIVSTLPNNAYGAYSGTSMAAPHVSGAAAVLWGANLGLGYIAVKNRLVNSRDPKGQFTRKIASSGRLNLYNALNEVYLPSNEPAETDWVNGDPITPIESAHPYLDNQTQEWVIQGPANAKFMRVRFARYDLEMRYDFVRLSGADGAEIDLLSGVSTTPVYSWYASGNEIRVKFISDSSVTKWGFVIDGYQYIPQ
jgi:subtilisin family serine protease